jgi:hypothetical protein
MRPFQSQFHFTPDEAERATLSAKASAFTFSGNYRAGNGLVIGDDFRRIYGYKAAIAEPYVSRRCKAVLQRVPSYACDAVVIVSSPCPCGPLSR